MRTIIIALITLLPVFAFNQDKIADFQLGETYDIVKGAKNLDFFGDEKVGFVNIFFEETEVTLYRFDPKTLSLTGREKIALPSKAKYPTNEGIVQFGEAFYWVYSSWENEKEKLYYNKINLKTGKFDEQNIEMFQTERVDGYVNKYSNDYTKRYKYQVIQDVTKKRLLVRSQPIPEKKRDYDISYQKVNLYAFDENMHQISGGEYMMPYVESKMDIIDYNIDSKGHIYILSRVKNDSYKQDEKENKQQTHYEVFVYIDGNKKAKIIPIGQSDYITARATLLVDSKGILNIGGIYYRTIEAEECEGVFLFRGVQGNDSFNLKKQYYAFSENELVKYSNITSEKKIEKDKNWDLRHLGFESLELDLNNNIILNCGIRYSYRTPNTTNTNYYYSDIFSSKIDSSGVLKWFKKMPKSNSYVEPISDDFLTFKNISYGAASYFIYADGKNMFPAENEKTKRNAGTWYKLLLAKVGDDGELQQEILYDDKEDLAFFPSRMFKVGYNQYIGIAHFKRKQCKPFRITIK